MRLFHFCLVILSFTLVSCVSTGKFKAMQQESQKYDSLYTWSQHTLATCQETNKGLNKQKASLQDQTNEMSVELTATKENNTQMRKQLQALSAISSAQAESIKKSMDNMGAKDTYFRDLQSALAHRDAVNLSLLMNLKAVLGGFGDQDVSIKLEKGTIYVDLSDSLLFGGDSTGYTVADRAKKVLSRLARVLNDQPDAEFMVEGHADSIIYLRDSTVSLRDSSVSVRDSTASLRDSSVSLRDSVMSQRDSVTFPRDSITVSRDSMTLSRDSSTSPRDSATSLRDSAIVSRDNITAQRDSIIPLRDSMTLLRDSVTSPQNSITPLRDSIKKPQCALPDNWDLSVKRATSVVRILQHDYNVSPVHMIAGGRSKYVTVAPNDTQEGRAANRRTRIVIFPQLDPLLKVLEHSQGSGQGQTEPPAPAVSASN